MAPRLSAAAGAEIDQILTDNPTVDLQQLAHQYSTTYKTMSVRRRKLRQRVATGIDDRRTPGPQPSATPEIKDFALWLISKDPELYLDEVATHIYFEFDVKLSTSTISRLWAECKVTHKKIQAEALQRNEVLIEAWKHKVARWKGEQLVFLDESACNERTGDRRLGWAKKGTPAVVKRLLKRTERLSVLPAYTWKGYYRPLVVTGSITAVIFENWLEHDILPDIPRYHGLRPIIVMDNAKVHKSQRVRDLCDQFECDLEYLPPYCPFFNPIEQSFFDLKAFVRRWYKVNEDGTYDNFYPFLKRALRWLGDTEEGCEKAIAHFRHSGYGFLFDEEDRG